MKRYIEYAKYLFKHKWYVFVECFREGLILQGLLHDISKFYPSEFIPYARHFYEKDGTKKQKRDKTGYYKHTNTGDPDFDYAWFLHVRRNPHHWQHWVIPEVNTNVAMLIPHKYVREMICDWVGAGKAQGMECSKSDRYFETRNWYRANKDKMILNPIIRYYVEYLIEYKG